MRKKKKKQEHSQRRRRWCCFDVAADGEEFLADSASALDQCRDDAYGMLRSHPHFSLLFLFVCLFFFWVFEFYLGVRLEGFLETHK